MYFDSYITGKRIQQLRKTKGLTQEQFAVKLNISDRHLGKIERGEGTASIDLLVPQRKKATSVMWMLPRSLWPF